MHNNTIIDRIAWFAGRHKGERAVIVANGPSLNKMSLDFLKKETCFGLNKIYLGIKKYNFYPKYIVAVNEKVIKQSSIDFAKMTCVKFIGERGWCFLNEDALTYHIKTLRPSDRFSRDITKGLHEGWTVTYAALQIAYYMGFNEIIIIRLDHKYEYTGLPSESKIMAGLDSNHFVPNYFERQEWDNPDLQRSEESFRIARYVYEQDGKRIIDATVNGACKVFEKGDYREIFNC